MLEIISVGPGDAALLTDDAKQAIARADAVWSEIVTRSR